MKSLLLAIVFVCLFQFSYGQEKSVFRTGSDTSFWYPYMTSLVDTFGEKQTQALYQYRVFRFSDLYTLLTILADSNKLSGSLSFVAIETGENGLGRTFKKRFDLSESQIRSIFLLIDSSKIGDIPSQKFIEGWQQGFDGIEYLLEEKRDSVISFQSYWSPSVQVSVPEASRVLSFVDRLYGLIKRSELSSRFQGLIPFDSWTYPGSGIGIIRVRPTKRGKSKGKIH